MKVFKPNKVLFEKSALKQKDRIGRRRLNLYLPPAPLPQPALTHWHLQLVPDVSLGAIFLCCALKMWNIFTRTQQSVRVVVQCALCTLLWCSLYSIRLKSCYLFFDVFFGKKVWNCLIDAKISNCCNYLSTLIFQIKFQE